MVFYRTQAEEWFGDADFRTVTEPGTTTIWMGRWADRFLSLDVANASSATEVKMDDARHFSKGGVIAVILNESGSLASVTILNANDDLIATVAAGNVAKVYLAENDTAAGTWVITQHAYNTSKAVL